MHWPVVQDRDKPSRKSYTVRLEGLRYAAIKFRGAVSTKIAIKDSKGGNITTYFKGLKIVSKRREVDRAKSISLLCSK